MSTCMAGLAALVAFLEELTATWIQRPGRRIREHHTQCVLVVDGHPCVPAELGKFRLWRDECPERQHEMIHAPVEPIVSHLAAGSYTHAARLLDALEGRPQIFLRQPFAGGALVIDATVQNGRVRGIDLTFDGLQPVRLLDTEGDMDVLPRH